MSDSREERYYQILGLKPTATENEVKHAWRDLVQVWHPDRFATNPRLQDKAARTLRDINDAYQRICAEQAAAPEQPNTHNGQTTTEPPAQQQPFRDPRVVHTWRGSSPVWSAALGSIFWRALFFCAASIAAFAVMTRTGRVMSGIVSQIGATSNGAREENTAYLSGELAARARTMGDKIAAFAKSGTPPDTSATVPTPPAVTEAPARGDRQGMGRDRSASAGIHLRGPLPVAGAGKLLIRNRTEAVSIAAIYREQAPSAILATYVVGPQQQATIKGVGPGGYLLRFQTGMRWDAEKGRFRGRSAMTKAVGPFRFTQIQGAGGIQSDHYEVVLTPDQLEH